MFLSFLAARNISTPETSKATAIMNCKTISTSKPIPDNVSHGNHTKYGSHQCRQIQYPHEYRRLLGGLFHKKNNPVNPLEKPFFIHAVKGNGGNDRSQAVDPCSSKDNRKFPMVMNEVAKKRRRQSA